ncbi:MAG: alpha/beta hydrolase [Saccharofermentans sp.]|nr:alpha/beta hydrolase [Saccharofermentans sp.]
MDISTPYEELVKDFLNEHQYQEATVNGAHFHYLLCGQGSTTLIFLVGVMGLSYLYMPYIKALESDYRILTFDYPYECTDNRKLADGISVSVFDGRAFRKDHIPA